MPLAPPEANHPDLDAYHSPPSGGLVKNAGAITYIHSYLFMFWCLMNWARGKICREQKMDINVLSLHIPAANLIP
jgi:hypothetical protein